LTKLLNRSVPTLSFKPETDPLVTIVVIGLRDAPMLLECLTSIYEHAIGVTYDVHIVLSDPTERLHTEVERRVSGAKVSRFQANLGFARAVNFAAGKSRSRYIALLNDDCLVLPGWLEALVETMGRRPTAGVLCGKLLYPDGTLQEAGSVLWANGLTDAIGHGSLEPVMDFERRVDYGSACSLLVRRDVWELVGGLPDAYYPAYFEDVDFCLSAAEKGWETWYQPKSVAFHHRSTSSSSELKSFLSERARMKFLERWGHVLPEREPQGQVERAVWKAMGSPIRVLVIDDIWPAPAQGSGRGRMYDILHCLARSRDMAVSFFGRLPAGPVGVEIPGVRVVGDLEAHLATEGVDYDVVIVSRPDNAEAYGNVLARFLPTSFRVYDAEALFHLRIMMQASLVEKEGNDSRQLLDAALAMREREASVLAWADHVVCLSEAEAEAARQLASTPVEVVSPWLESPRPTPASFRGRTGMAFVAGWAAGPGSPNCDALKWFARDILPRVRARAPGASLRVTGADPPPDVRWLDGPAVEFTGELSDLEGFYNSVRVAVSPTRFGAGVKVKTIEAIQYGVPIVCTSESASGLTPAMRQAVWVADDPADFAAALVDLLSNEWAWERQRRLCLQAVRGGDARSPSDIRDQTWPSMIRCLASQRASIRRDGGNR
jgi:GT2 family glycosyltransferase/glycosyltransferase involved in cell wall biosynthesis